MGGRLDTTRTVAAVALCLVLALGGQAVADSLVPEASGAETGRAVGRAANSYLTGIRTYAAAALWNRIDPLIHNYYTGLPIEEQLYLMSTIAAVEALDPTFVRSYYVGAWILVQNDRVTEGLEMAERGVESNPDEGILLAGYAQLLALNGLTDQAAEMAERALEGDTVWGSRTDEYNSYTTLRYVFQAAGRSDLDAIAAERMAELNAEEASEEASGEADHEDHDHD